MFPSTCTPHDALADPLGVLSARNSHPAITRFPSTSAPCDLPATPPMNVLSSTEPLQPRICAPMLDPLGQVVDACPPRAVTPRSRMKLPFNDAPVEEYG